MSAMPNRNAMQGMSLIELMVAMVIGLVVLGAVTGIFLTSQQAYRTMEGLGRVQETMQFGFELMARDLREAGGNPCDTNLPPANVADLAGATWWTNWTQPVNGFDDGTFAQSVGETDAVQALIMDNTLANVTNHVGTVITVDNAAGFAANDVLMACDMRQIAIFRAASVTTATGAISHSHAGNCSTSLNVLPAPCDASAPPYLYSLNSVVSRLRGVRWYVGDNGRGGTSLFRQTNAAVAEEMVEGVQDMQIEYLQGAAAGSYVAAGAVTNWGEVTSMRIALTAQSEDEVGTDGESVVRQLEHVVNLRNRML